MTSERIRGYEDVTIATQKRQSEYRYCDHEISWMMYKTYRHENIKYGKFSFDGDEKNLVHI